MPRRIAVLFGIYEIGALILIFGLNAVMNLFGLLMEKMNQKAEKINWLPFIYGAIAGIIPWIVIIMYAFVSFNKVITMQYYMWVIGALLLVLPESTLLTNKHRRFQKAFSYIMQWMLGILLWVWLSIKLEK